MQYQKRKGVVNLVSHVHIHAVSEEEKLGQLILHAHTGIHAASTLHTYTHSEVEDVVK